MITVTGLFPDRIVKRVFDNIYDAMDFRYHLDAHYAKVVWTQT